MAQLLALFVRAVRLWWGEFLLLVFLNVVWLAAQVTIVLGPPTTAALYALAEKIVDGELVSPRDFWQAWRQHAAAAWAWGAVNLVVVGVLVFNLVFYGERQSLLFLSLRYTWSLLLFVWLAINLYYWPLYFAQADRRLRTTLANAARMALLHPGATIAYALLVLVLITLSILTGLLLGAALGAWLTLWGVLVVRERLSLVQK